jgi:outer membrane protein assembly factor BamB
MSAMILCVVAAFGGVGWLVWHKLAKTEEERLHAAVEDFSSQRYVVSGQAFQELAKDFPESPRVKEYEFLAELSHALQPGRDVGGDPKEALEGLELFLKAQDRDSLVRDHQKPIRETLEKIAGDLAEKAKQLLPNVDQARETLQDARRALAEARKFGEAGNESMPALLADVDRAITRSQEREETLAQLRRFGPTARDIQRAEDLVGRQELAADPQVREILDRLKEAFLDEVRYTPSQEKLLPPSKKTAERGLVMVPPVAGPTAPTADEGVVFALARGVLYALAKRDGKFLWAARVGIDTSTLPVRLPAGETTPEIALVLSSDTNTLTARDIFTGHERWRHALKAPCLGRPVLVGHRAYVPTYQGKIYELEVISGQLLGWFHVNMPLTVGGAHREGTDLLYFPAESQYVYVLDVKLHKCVGVLQSGHPSDSLRGAPIVIASGSIDPNAPNLGRPNYLLLNQTDGLEGTKLQAFPLPVQKMARIPPLEPVIRVPGWSWFEPHCNGECIAFATDAGVFTLLGINQPRNLDTPLFRLLPDFKSIGPNVDPLNLGRAQVVHVEENDFWVLVEGKLQHLQLAIDREKGLQVTKDWELPSPLGAPLHAGQVSANRDHLFIVTQMSDQEVCLATAVDSSTGGILWQRHLGMVCQGDPLRVGGQVLTLDQEAGLFLFDPARDRAGTEDWRMGGRLVAQPLKDSSNTAAYLVPAPDGRTVYAIRYLESTKRLAVRRFEPGKEVVTDFHPLSWPPGGTPAVGLDCLVVPQLGGNLLRLPLRDTGSEQTGGAWRAPGADKTIPGHVVHLGADEFLVTDGSRGLSRWRWTTEGAKKEQSIELKDRVVAAPVLLLPPQPEGDRHVGVADAAGGITLLDPTRLEVVRHWQVGGQVTAGPYTADGHIGCVVDQRRLVWIDPDKEEFWHYDSPGEGIVGRPQIVGGTIVVADLSGKIVGLDPADGKQRGEGYTLQASVSPAAAPVAFGPDEAFVHLTDGTVLLLPLDHFRAAP